MDIREEILECALKLCEADLTRLSAGNVSARTPDGSIAITPSGVSYQGMKPDDIVLIDLEGTKLEGRYKPSSEWRLHTCLYSHLPNVNAIIHTHSIYAIVFAALGKPIPAVSLEAVLAGGPIPIGHYACPGTVEAGEAAYQAMMSQPGVTGALLQNHGLVATGPTLNAAFQNAYNIETAAHIYHAALQVGTPIELTSEQIAEIWRVYKSH